MLTAGEIFGLRPAPVPPWLSSRTVLAIAVEMLPTIGDDLTANLIERMACTIVDREDEHRAARAVLSESLARAHAMHAENVRLQKRLADLLDGRRQELTAASSGQALGPGTGTGAGTEEKSLYGKKERRVGTGTGTGPPGTGAPTGRAQAQDSIRHRHRRTMDMRKKLGLWLTGAAVHAMRDRYEGTIAAVVEQGVRNKWTRKTTLESVIVFIAGKQLVLNRGIQFELIDRFGYESDDWVGERIVIASRCVVRTDTKTGKALLTSEKFLPSAAECAVRDLALASVDEQGRTSVTPLAPTTRTTLTRSTASRGNADEWPV